MRNLYILFVMAVLFSCKIKDEEADKSTEAFSHEDVVSMEKTSLFSN